MFFSKKLYFFILFILVKTNIILAQGELIDLYTYNPPNLSFSISIKVKKSKIKCEEVTDVIRIKHRVSIENSPKLQYLVDNNKINKYFSWNFEVITCKGERKIIPCSIDLTDNASEGIVDLPDLTFEAKEFKVIGNSVKNERSFEKERIIKDPNIAPVFISGINEVYPEDEIILTAQGVCN